MDSIRRLVSKQKKRFQDDGFDLDLSYITPQIIAMGFPAVNLEGMYRNSMKDVQRFLLKYHQGHYRVYNLCVERSYNPGYFNHACKTIPFDDHCPPKFDQMIEFCRDAEAFMHEHPDNTIVVHCKAGKGRTGCMISAFLQHIGASKDAKEALLDYAKARTFNLEGVTIPSQQRYVHYYGKYLSEYVENQTKKEGARKEWVVGSAIPLVFTGVRCPALPSSSTLVNCTPYVIIIQNGEKVYSSKPAVATLSVPSSSSRGAEEVSSSSSFSSLGSPGSRGGQDATLLHSADAREPWTGLKKLLMPLGGGYPDQGPGTGAGGNGLKEGMTEDGFVVRGDMRVEVWCEMPRTGGRRIMGGQAMEHKLFWFYLHTSFITEPLVTFPADDEEVVKIAGVKQLHVVMTKKEVDEAHKDTKNKLFTSDFLVQARFRTLTSEESKVEQVLEEKKILERKRKIKEEEEKARKEALQWEGEAERSTFAREGKSVVKQRKSKDNGASKDKPHITSLLTTTGKDAASGTPAPTAASPSGTTRGERVPSERAATAAAAMAAATRALSANTDDEEGEDEDAEFSQLVNLHLAGGLGSDRGRSETVTNTHNDDGALRGLGSAQLGGAEDVTAGLKLPRDVPSVSTSSSSSSSSSATSSATVVGTTATTSAVNKPFSWLGASSHNISKALNIKNIFREVVSKEKKRFKEDGFNLDLSYITPTVIAMGYPSLSTEGLYRNPMPDVQRFLSTRHTGHYRIYNLCSEREYNGNQFFELGSCVHFPFDDHNPPSFDTLLDLVLDMAAFQAKNPALNTVVVHCKAGKGRTGTILAAHLLFQKVNGITTAAAALDYFAEKRTNDGAGVTIPSQRRYVHYFEEYLRHNNFYLPPSPQGNAFSLKEGKKRAAFKQTAKIRLQGFVLSPALAFKASFSIVDIAGKVLYDEADGVYDDDDGAQPDETDATDNGFIQTYTLRGQGLVINGDVKVLFTKERKGTGGAPKLFQFWIHSGFVDQDNVILAKHELDGACKDKKHKLFPASFAVETLFSTLNQSRIAGDAPLTPLLQWLENKQLAALYPSLASRGIGSVELLADTLIECEKLVQAKLGVGLLPAVSLLRGLMPPLPAIPSATPPFSSSSSAPPSSPSTTTSTTSAVASTNTVTAPAGGVNAKGVRATPVSSTASTHSIMSVTPFRNDGHINYKGVRSTAASSLASDRDSRMSFAPGEHRREKSFSVLRTVSQLSVMGGLLPPVSPLLNADDFDEAQKKMQEKKKSVMEKKKSILMQKTLPQQNAPNTTTSITKPNEVDDDDSDTTDTSDIDTTTDEDAEEE